MRFMNFFYICALFATVALVACGGQSNDARSKHVTNPAHIKRSLITKGLRALIYKSYRSNKIKTIRLQGDTVTYTLDYQLPVCANVNLPTAYSYTKTLTVEGAKQKLFGYLNAFDRELNRSSMTLAKKPNDAILTLEYGHSKTKSIDFSAIQRALNSVNFDLVQAFDDLDNYISDLSDSADQTATDEQEQANRKCEDLDFQRHPERYPSRLVVATYARCIMLDSLQTGYRSGESALKIYADRSFEFLTYGYKHNDDCKGHPDGEYDYSDTIHTVFRDATFQISTFYRKMPKVADNEIVFANRHSWGYGSYYQFDIIPVFKKAYLHAWQRGMPGYELHKPYTSLMDILVDPHYLYTGTLTFKLQQK